LSFRSEAEESAVVFAFAVAFVSQSEATTNAIQLPTPQQPIDTHDKLNPDTNSPAQAGLHHLTHHLNQPKSNPKVSPSKTLRNKPQEGEAP
jgi:hypothetical protein